MHPARRNRYCTMSVTCTVCVSAPLAPVTVSVYVPDLDFFPVVTVIAVVPSGAGAKLARAPFGRPVTLNDTVPVKPFIGFTAML